MKSLRETSGSYDKDKLGRQIMVAIMKEMVTQCSDRNWVLKIGNSVENKREYNYYINLVWGDEDYHRNCPSPKINDTVLLMNYYKLEPCTDKDSTKMFLYEHLLSVTVSIQRIANETDKEISDKVASRYRDIEKTVKAIINSDTEYVYGDNNLPR